MKIHEYQATAILARYGVTTPRGEVAFTKEEALQAAQRLKSNICVVKAQIHAGGRGKGGGVKLARSAEEAADIAGHILGMKLVTPQTGPGGRIVKRLLIDEQALDNAAAGPALRSNQLPIANAASDTGDFLALERYLACCALSASAGV